eukprot:scaffold123079_cov63-Phaeocystis_antarctica.AAC.3
MIVQSPKIGDGAAAVAARGGARRRRPGRRLAIQGLPLVPPLNGRLRSLPRLELVPLGVNPLPPRAMLVLDAPALPPWRQFEAAVAGMALGTRRLRRGFA